MQSHLSEELSEKLVPLPELGVCASFPITLLLLSQLSQHKETLESSLLLKDSPIPVTPAANRSKYTL